MDLSFSLPTPAADAALPAADRALLTALLAGRTDGSVTARTQAALDGPAGVGTSATEPLLAPATGAFSAAMAARLTRWRNE